MIITNLKGGLGNQMFQYAAGLSLSIERDTLHKLETEHFTNDSFKKETKRKFELDSFNISSDFASEQEILSVKYPYPLLSKLIVLVNSYLLAHNYITYPLSINRNSKDIYLDGYFQREKYFIKHRDLIKREFSLKEELIDKKFKDIENLIIDSRDKSVSIHIRRGDYITNIHANKHHGVLDDSYYINAIKLLKDRLKDIQLFIFSDDIEWVKSNLKFLDKGTTFVSEYGFNSAQEITLMSKCQNNVIANSSFSWWGAWLNENKNKIVIAPNKWLRNGDGIHKDIVPEGWIRI